MSKLWMAVLSLDGQVCLTALQRLSSLLPSSAPTDEQKMEAAALLAETLTQTWVADEKKKEHRQKVHPSLELELCEHPDVPMSLLKPA